MSDMAVKFDLSHKSIDVDMASTHRHKRHKVKASNAVKNRQLENVYINAQKFNVKINRNAREWPMRDATTCQMAHFSILFYRKIYNF